MRLLDSGLSRAGARTARGIMALEPILKAIEEAAGRSDTERRNPEHYWFSIFGDPAGDEPWAWRVGGHHLCLHFTVVGGAVAVTPLFFGANPAHVPSGPEAGLRVLAAEEDLARSLLASLDDRQRRETIVSPDAPRDILTRNEIRAEVAAAPTGIAYSSLRPDQQAGLTQLVELYLGRVDAAPPVQTDRLSFAWAGSTERGQGHYYAVRSDDFLIEYDNTQNDANHIHTVWRDRLRDWGEDLLAQHYQQSHPR